VSHWQPERRLSWQVMSTDSPHRVAILWLSLPGQTVDATRGLRIFTSTRDPSPASGSRPTDRGRTYDALRRCCAKKAFCDRICTFNVRHFEQLALALGCLSRTKTSGILGGFSLGAEVPAPLDLVRHHGEIAHSVARPVAPALSGRD
jgi:hypothetical protein